jgi:hypothetical protein
MHVELHHTITELKGDFRKEKTHSRAIRIRAVYLALMEKTRLSNRPNTRLQYTCHSEMDPGIQPQRP